jgi:hypothetical protein
MALLFYTLFMESDMIKNGILYDEYGEPLMKLGTADPEDGDDFHLVELILIGAMIEREG